VLPKTKFNFHFSKISTNAQLSPPNPTQTTAHPVGYIPNPPKVHGWNETHVTKNVNKTQVKLWQQVPTLKIFVYLWNGTYQEDATLIIEQIQEMIADILKVPLLPLSRTTVTSHPPYAT
jgi:hypothetical protein